MIATKRIAIVFFIIPLWRIAILSVYLDVLTEDNLLEKIRIGRDSFYVNVSMIDILVDSDSETLKIDS